MYGDFTLTCDLVSDEGRDAGPEVNIQQPVRGKSNNGKTLYSTGIMFLYCATMYVNVNSIVTRNPVVCCASDISN